MIFGGWWTWSNFSQGIDVELYNCELHRVEQCEWHKNLDDWASCRFTNTAKVPVKMSGIRTWSYTEDGVQLYQAPLMTGVVNPGRTVQVDVMMHEDAHRAYICSLDPESEIGRGVLKGQLKPVSIS